ncbi:MAG: hypothetical protein GXO49_07660, partial [Chlorobi bacterium]|nr:hypothetical protein [Chlorobiota bacterium]
MLKKGIILLTIILMIIFGSVGLYVNTSSFKARLKSELEENFRTILNDKVNIQKMSFSPYSGQIRFKNITSQKYGKIEKIVLKFSVLDLFKQKLVVKRADIEGVKLTIPMSVFSSSKTREPKNLFETLHTIFKKNTIQKLQLSKVSINLVENGNSICKLEQVNAGLSFLETEKQYKGEIKCDNGQLLLTSSGKPFAFETEFFLTDKQLSVEKLQIVSGLNVLKISGKILPHSSKISADLVANISDFVDITPLNKLLIKVNVKGSLKELAGTVNLSTDFGNIAGRIEVESGRKIIKFAKCKCSYQKNNIEISGQYVFKDNHNGFIDLNIEGKYFQKIELHGQFKNKITKNYFVKGILIDNYNNVSKFSFNNIYNIKLPIVNCSFPFLKAKIVNNKGVVDFSFKNFKGKLEGEFLKDKLFKGFAKFEKFNLFNTEYPKFQGDLTADYKGNVEAKTITLYDNNKGYATGSGKFSKTEMALNMQL